MDDPDFIDIIRDNREEATSMYVDMVKKEKDFLAYGFQYGSMMGMNLEIGCATLDWRAEKQMRSINLVYPYSAPKNTPLPWMNSYLNESDSQKPPQDADITSYVKGLESDIETNSFEGFEL
jgi:ribonucleotide reductase beta subunit family protein with ferritin-like domain